MSKPNCRCERCMGQEHCKAEKEAQRYVHVDGQGNPPELTAETTTSCEGCEKRDKIIELLAHRIVCLRCGGVKIKDDVAVLGEITRFTAQAEKELANDS